MNAIYAIGSVYSKHPVIVNGGGDSTNPLSTANIGNSFAGIAAKELHQIVFEDLDENETPSFLIASILLHFYENSMNLVRKTKDCSGICIFQFQLFGEAFSNYILFE